MMNSAIDLKYKIVFRIRLSLVFLILIGFNSNYIFAKNSLFIIPHLPLLKYHAFHTSITQIDYNTTSKIYEISIRIFTDDFAKAIEAENKIKNLRIEDVDKNNGLVSEYISKHFLITSPQNKKLNYKYIGKENEDLATWIYLELAASSINIGTKIQQNILMELFDDQVNILNYRKGNERKTLLFDSKNKLKIWE